MPVKAVGKNIVEKGTGKVVGHSKSAKKAKSAATMRNMAHAVKKGYISKESFERVKDKAGNTDYELVHTVMKGGAEPEGNEDVFEGMEGHDFSKTTYKEIPGTNTSQVKVSKVKIGGKAPF